MDLALTDEQLALVSTFDDLFAKESAPHRVRAAEPLGYDPKLWTVLSEVGAVAMAVGEEHGGFGATLVDLSLVASSVGRFVASAPVIETQVAARLLSRLSAPAARSALDQALAGDQLVTLAVRPVTATGALLVPGGGICDALVALHADRLLLAPAGDGNRQLVANLASAPLADVEILDPLLLAEGPEAVAAFESALDEWLALTAAALVGIAGAAHRTTCEYARERHAFGKPIGSFQGVAYPLADDATRIDGAELLSRKAAWALETSHPRGRELAAMAFAFAAETADQATYHAVHFHGGYGFMLEHDVQLFYRRARGWARVWGDGEAGLARAAAARYGTAEGER